MSTDATAGPAALASCGGRKTPKKSGRKARPLVSTTPTRSEPTNAPRIEPMPPMTITTKARMRMFSPMPTCTARIGPSIEPAKARHLEERADDRRGDERERQPEPERAGHLREARHEIRADHVQRAVREVDHIHDAEHQRQAGGEQKQHQPELQAVQRLLEEKDRGHRKIGTVPIFWKQGLSLFSGGYFMPQSLSQKS